jgi:hypothetical protein
MDPIMNSPAGTATIATSSRSDAPVASPAHPRMTTAASIRMRLGGPCLTAFLAVRARPTQSALAGFTLL